MSDNKLPLFIKVPAVAAVFLAVVLVLVIALEGPAEKDLPLCQIKKEGRLGEGKEKSSLITHFFRNEEGVYIAGTLNASKDTWSVSRLLFAQDYTPYLEKISSKQNLLSLIGDSSYKLLGSFEEWSFLRTKEQRIIPLVIQKDEFFVKNALGLCGRVWDAETRVARLNDRISVLSDNHGRLGFYDMSRFSDVIPRETPRPPDTYMGVEMGNKINVESCARPFSNTKASVRVTSGLFAFSSGETREISVYKVSPDELKLTPIQLGFQVEQFSDFFVTPSSYIGVKANNLLDRNERWNLRAITSEAGDTTKTVNIGKPLAFQHDYYAFEEQVPKSFWLAESAKKWMFFNSYILSHVAADGSKKSFQLADGLSQEALTENGVWRVLPGNRHIFISNKESNALQYSMLECPL